MLKGKHALERAGQKLKELSTCKKSGTAKSSAMSLPDDDASLLISFLERLGWTFEREGKTPKKKLCAWLTQSTGRDTNGEELEAVSAQYDAYAKGLTIPGEHCLGVATYLQSDPLRGAVSGHWAEDAPSPHFVHAEQLQFDAK